MRRRCRKLDEVFAWRCRDALFLTGLFWSKRAWPYLCALPDAPDALFLDGSDCYGALRLAALQAACGASSWMKRSRFRRNVWMVLRGTFYTEIRRAGWWLTDKDHKRLMVSLAAGASPTADLLIPLSFHEITEAAPDRLTHLGDDLPDREAISTHETVCRRMQAEELRRLIARLAPAQRRPTWLVYGEGLDYYTASRELGVKLRVCRARADGGLARLRKWVQEDPGCLLPPGDDDLLPS